MPSFVNSICSWRKSLQNVSVYIWQANTQMVLSLCAGPTCGTYFTAVSRVTWLSRVTVRQMHPTCLMPLNHDKVDFMRKPESTPA